MVSRSAPPRDFYGVSPYLRKATKESRLSGSAPCAHARFEKVGTVVDFDFWRKAPHEDFVSEVILEVLQDGTSLGKGTCQFDHYRGAQPCSQHSLATTCT